MTVITGSGLDHDRQMFWTDTGLKVHEHHSLRLQVCHGFNTVHCHTIECVLAVLAEWLRCAMNLNFFLLHESPEF